MNQIKALENAHGALRWFSEQGNDEAEEAMDVIYKMLGALVRRRARQRTRYRRAVKANKKPKEVL